MKLWVRDLSRGMRLAKGNTTVSQEQDFFTISLETQVTKKTNLLHESESKARIGGNGRPLPELGNCVALEVMVTFLVPSTRSAW